MFIANNVLRYIDEHPMCTDEQVIDGVVNKSSLSTRAVINHLLEKGLVLRATFSGRLFVPKV